MWLVPLVVYNSNLKKILVTFFFEAEVTKKKKGKPKIFMEIHNFLRFSIILDMIA